MKRKLNMQIKQRIILAGGSGFLGTLLAQELSMGDYEVVVLSRT
jgi:nucleoside-diphosphate-sugar epimerase